MAFLTHSTDSGRVPSIEYLPCGAITPKVGMALIQTGGNLGVATGDKKPTYISMMDSDITLTAGDLIPVIRVLPDMIFETTNSAAFTSVKRGDRVTLHASNGLQVTATVAGGTAEVIEISGTVAGSNILVRFS